MTQMQDNDFNTMSREELISYIGVTDIDPDTPREDLIVMAMKRDTNG